jgi:DNA-binding NarL/FixJ family response regulator
LLTGRAKGLAKEMVVDVVEDNLMESDLIKRVLLKAGLRAGKFFSSAEAAIEAYDAGPRPDILLMDVQLPGMNGLEATAFLHKKHPEMDVVMLTGHDEPELIMKAIKAGISGYVMKTSMVKDLAPALLEVGRGGSFLSGTVARTILSEVTKEPTAKIGAFKLSPRESETLKLLVVGDSYKQIGDKLHLSVHTVNNHIRKIYKKLRVSSRHEAVAKTTS